MEKIAINSNLYKLLSTYNPQSLECKAHFDKIGHQWTDNQHWHEILSMSFSIIKRQEYHHYN